MAFGKKVLASDIAPFVISQNYATPLQLKRIQSLTYSPDLTTEFLYELANAAAVEQKSDIPKVSVSIERNDFDESFTANKAIFNKAATATTIVLPTDYLTSLPRFEMKVPIRWDGTFSETDWISNIWLDSFSVNFDVNGYIRSTYSGTGDHMAYYSKITAGDGAKDAYVMFGAYTSSVAFTVVGDFTTATGYTKQALRVNGQIIDISTVTPGAFGATTSIGVSGGILASGDYIVYVCSKNTAAAYPALTSSSSSIGGLKRGCADLYLRHNDSGSYAKWYRVQSAAITSNLSGADLLEVGSKYQYDKSINIPMETTLAITINKNSLTELYVFAGKAEASDTSVSLIDLVATGALADFKAEVFKSDTSKVEANFVQRFFINDLKITSIDHPNNAGTDAQTMTINMKGDNLTIENVWTSSQT